MAATGSGSGCSAQPVYPFDRNTPMVYPSTTQTLAVSCRGGAFEFKGTTYQRPSRQSPSRPDNQSTTIGFRTFRPACLKRA